YSCKVDGRIDAEGVRRRTTRTGSMEFLETSRYQVAGLQRCRVKGSCRIGAFKLPHSVTPVPV
ncbi:hypothetical protein NE556_23660, partial [[Clostridium] symbiosum]|nr:hypothetical protein [[Clostridium] symbiosum]